MFHFMAYKLIQLFQEEYFRKDHNSFFHKGRDLWLLSQKPIGRMTSEQQKTDSHTSETAGTKAKVLAISKLQEMPLSCSQLVIFWYTATSW